MIHHPKTPSESNDIKPLEDVTENACVLSHASDIDGVGSAALIRLKYGVPVKRLFFSDYSKDGIAYVRGKLSSLCKNGITLFITDLGVNDSLIYSYKRTIAQVKRNGGRVIWFDHHPWTERGIRELASECEIAVIGENEKYCATEITYRKLGFKGSFAKKFADIVHYSDFNLRPERRELREIIGYYALSITSYNMDGSRDRITSRLRHMADVISSGKLIDQKIKCDATRFKEINDRRVAAMLRSMEIRKGFAVGFSKDVQSTSGCMSIIEGSRMPIAIYVNTRNGRVHIRSLKKDINPLARSMGGGGHPKASGFSIRLRKFGYFRSKSSRSKFADSLEDVMMSL